MCIRDRCGAHTAAHGIVPDYGIAVDVTCTDDVPGSRHTVSAALGKGAGIKVMDGSLMCHGAVVERLKELAAGHGIPAQPDLMSAGGTDAGPMHISHDGVLAGGISIPCRGIHSPVEMADLGDVDACIRLAAAFASSRLE